MRFWGPFMPRPLFVVAATLLGAVALAQPALAQDDFTTATFGGTTIWVGGGVQFLSLPDIKFTYKGGPGNFRRQTNSSGDWLDFGGATAGGIETALGYWGGMRASGSVKGFWANVEDDDTTRCSGAGAYCAVVDPTGGFVTPSTSLVTKANREADYWGAQAELKLATGAPTEVKPTFYRNDYFIAGFDVRGIDQNNKLRSATGTNFIYKETSIPPMSAAMSASAANTASASFPASRMSAASTTGLDCAPSSTQQPVFTTPRRTTQVSSIRVHLS